MPSAQAAYVSSDTGTEKIIASETTNNDSDTIGDYVDVEYRPRQSFTLSYDTIITQLKITFNTTYGSPSGQVTCRIETDNGSDQASGTLAHANATFAFTPTTAAVYTIDFTDFPLVVGKYWIVWNCDNQNTNVRWSIACNESGTYTGGHHARTIDGVWNSLATYDETFQLYGIQANIQSYSEATIKTQGSYSLKGIALITDSLNDTLTRTVSPTIDLSNQNTLRFDIYSSRTGSNIKIGIYDATVPTTTEITPNILVANVWQTVTWDISAVTNANKNAISKVIITIVNADAANTFYIDNFYAASLLTTSRYWTFADWQSGRALINTDVGLYTYLGTGDVSSVSAAPLSKFIVIWRNYVFAAGIRGLPNTIRYSDLSDYATWTAANTLNVNTNDGDVITGMRILKGKLYIFKRYSIHRISYLGSNPTFQVDQILGIGCPAHYTIKEVEFGGDIGTVLIFLTTDKKLAIFDGYNMQIINDNLTEETNDLFGATDDQPLSFSDMNLVYSDLFHAVVKTDTSEYILYCVLGTDTAINYAFVFDYKTGGIYPYDGQPFASSCYPISTNKSKILYCAGYTGYMWQQESGNSDDGSVISAYWVSGKIKPSLVSMLTKALQLGINLKEVSSASTLNLDFQFRIDWNVSWTTAEAFAYNRADAYTFGKTALFDIGTIENMLQIKIKDNSSNPAVTLYGVDLYGQQLGLEVGERATA